MGAEREAMLPAWDSCCGADRILKSTATHLKLPALLDMLGTEAYQD